MSSLFKNLFSFPSERRSRRRSELASTNSDNHAKTRRHSVPEPARQTTSQSYLEPIHEVDLELLIKILNYYSNYFKKNFLSSTNKSINQNFSLVLNNLFQSSVLN